jgi:hypothetical protein
MICRSLVLASLLALGGCAQQGVTHPAYLGLSDLASDAEASPEAVSGPQSEALRHVQSNKVLGAMAFQRVTGRTVDPSSLSGSGRD